jgi:hypothetical protein
MSTIVEALLKRNSLTLIGLGILLVLLAVGATIPFAGKSLGISGTGTYVVGALGIVCFVVGMALEVHEHLRRQPFGERRSPFGQPLAMSAYAPGQATRVTSGSMRRSSARSTSRTAPESAGCRPTW